MFKLALVVLFGWLLVALFWASMAADVAASFVQALALGF